MNAISPGSTAIFRPDITTPSALLGTGAKAAREFEAHLIGPLLESLEKTFATVPGEDSVPGADDYNYLGVQAMAGVLAEHGGFGIAAMISRYLEKHESDGEAGYR